MELNLRRDFTTPGAEGQAIPSLTFGALKISFSNTGGRGIIRRRAVPGRLAKDYDAPRALDILARK